ncbi:hypothetical protein OAX78_02035 [Planctomycetota bacterium]|nr:hypothetical protein [Planctomycetota bacterium]
MDIEDESRGCIASLVFGGAGLLMLYNIVSGEAEIVHRGGTSRALGTILGDNGFLVLTCGVCLLLGAVGFYSFAAGFFENGSDPSRRDAASVDDSAKPRPKRSQTEAIRFSCPHCEETSRIPAKYEGRRGLCPKCKAEVEVRTDPRL